MPTTLDSDVRDGDDMKTRRLLGCIVVAVTLTGASASAGAETKLAPGSRVTEGFGAAQNAYREAYRRAGGGMTQELAEAYSRYVYEHAASEVLRNEMWGHLPDEPAFAPVHARPIHSDEVVELESLRVRIKWLEQRVAELSAQLDAKRP